MTDMVIKIGAAPKMESGGTGSQAGDLKDVAWKKDVEKLLKDVMDILSKQAQEQVVNVAQHIEMAMKELTYEPETTDAEDMMKSKKDPMSMFGEAEDVSSENT